MTAGWSRSSRRCRACGRWCWWWGWGRRWSSRVSLAGEAAHVVVAPTGAFAVVASGRHPRGRRPGGACGPRGSECWRRGPLPLSVAERTGRDRGARDGAAGELVGVRVDPKAQHPLKERFRTRLPAPVVAVATAGEDVAAISGDSLVVLTRGWAADRQTGPAAGGARPRRALRRRRSPPCRPGATPQNLDAAPAGKPCGQEKAD